MPTYEYVGPAVISKSRIESNLDGSVDEVIHNTVSLWFTTTQPQECQRKKDSESDWVKNTVDRYIDDTLAIRYSVMACSNPCQTIAIARREVVLRSDNWHASA